MSSSPSMGEGSRDAVRSARGAAAARPRSPRRGPLARALLALLAAAVAGGCARSAPPVPAVLVVSIDTLRPDHLGIYGYARDTSPHIDAYFANGVRFDRAYSTGSRTPPSVASLLTGRHPQQHRVRLFYQKLDRRVPAIPDLLPDAWQAAAFVGNAVLSNEAMGLAPRFDRYEDRVDRPALFTQNVERSAGPLTDEAIAWLEGERDPARPFFLWVHYMDPHSPYIPPDDWRARGYAHDAPQMVDVERLAQNNVQKETAGDAAQVDALVSVDAYDEEIAYTDHHIGRLLAAFDRAADADTALAILTADHGESMLEHQIYFTHGYQVYDEMVRIPMLVRAPGVAPGANDRLVSLVDVLPTVLGFALVEPPHGLDGVDLRQRGADPERTVLAETTYVDSHWRAAWSGDEKWLMQVDVKSAEPVAGFRFDLAADPGELAPAPWDETAAPARRLRELALRDPDPAGIPKERRGGLEDGAPNARADLLRGQLEQLRALGYVD
ncbi:MAG: sulfatase [Myxococcota bacterium]